MPQDLFQSRAELEALWDTLPDVDKAARIAELIAFGMTGRTLAKSLHKSEGLIRHLRILNDALPREKQLAREGELSTRKLVRIVEARRRRKENHQKAIEADSRIVESLRASKEIVNWLGKSFLPAYAEQLIDEARRLLAAATETDTLPKDRAPDGMTITEIIDRCDSKVPRADDSLSLARSACWLALWTFFGYPDANVRDKALDLAWATMIKH